VRIGIGIETGSLEQALAGTRRAAAEGFSSAWFANIFGLDALVTAAVVGAAVGGIEVGTAVVPVQPRHPFSLAQQAATAQAAAGGRFVLGIGLSHQVVIETMLGLDFSRPAEYLREYLSVLLPLLREGSVAYRGERFSVQASLERPAGAPPLLVAALGPVMLRLAGELADGTVTWMTGPRTLREHTVPSIRAAAERAGRPAPRVVAGLPVCVTDDPRAARERAGRIFAVYGTLPSYRAMLEREGVAGPEDVAVVGDEDAVGEVLEQLANAGVTDLNASVFGSSEERERTRAFLARMAAARRG
jgi:5,10-methylenetetrahydromethanopterin reductase